MPSMRSRIVTFLFKNRHLFRGRFTPPAVDWTSREAILRFREECEQGAKRFGTLPKGIAIRPVTLGSLPAEWILPASTEHRHTIFFVHGGGYVSGSCADHRIHAAKFVKGTGVRALLHEYRLAPEHPYPAALEDTVGVYGWLIDQGVLAHEIVLVGDSAGGGLCLATLLALRDRGLPLPAAAAVLSPWTDLTCAGESYRSNARRCLSPEGIWTACSRHYCGEHDPALPWISPLHGELHGLPPLFVNASSDEILRDDALAFADKAQAAGVEVTLRLATGLFHCYPVCAPLFPEATQAMEELCAFIRNALRIP